MLTTPGIDPSTLDFTGKRVLVTGAAGGIGDAIARAFPSARRDTSARGH